MGADKRNLRIRSGRNQNAEQPKKEGISQNKNEKGGKEKGMRGQIPFYLLLRVEGKRRIAKIQQSETAQSTSQYQKRKKDSQMKKMVCVKEMHKVLE